MKLSLVVMTAGKMEGKVLEIKVPQFLIGRDADCQLRPASPLISKRHCAILQREDQVFIQDFGSTNGTHVNDQPITGEVELNDGDMLKVGPIQFTVRLERAVSPSALAKAPHKPLDREAKMAGMDPRKRSAMEAKTIPSPTPTPSPNPAAKPAAPAPAAARTEVSKKTPPPQNTGSADDDIAAMLLSLGDDSTSGALSASDVPDGSTVHDLKVPEGVLDKEGGEKKDELAKVKAAQANTSSAAKSILEKYMKRPRS